MRTIAGLAAGCLLFVALTTTAWGDVSDARQVNPWTQLGLDIAALARPVAGKDAGKTGASGNDGVFDDAWLMKQPQAKGDAQFDCLAKAIYFEARGESPKGQAAVAEVILNRTERPDFPATICGVVHQSGNGGCQFSFVCDGIKDRVHEPEAWARSAKIARAMLDGADRSLTDGATYFHTVSTRPSWSRRFEKTVRIGQHLFYRAPPVRTAMN